ncbi:L-amino acid transmembrane transporter [Malassezia pachydermatis]|uniref:Neutral amino acid permease n=1 Tax=Malassezia pachydermatis TaxID=77020 RepID=A0A0M8MX98_9BASI|nr:neutral amino acid permease [Malassezia pachydermatis]KOS16164.1 neutral amino acid permease [Malassezia pachydermatis]
MDPLWPDEAEVPRRTIVSYLFAHGDQALTRRIKYTEDISAIVTETQTEHEKDYDQEIVQEPIHATNEPTTETVKYKADTLDDGMLEGVNGAYTDNQPKPFPRTLGFFGAFFNMIAYAIALGILSIPVIVATIGIVPFILVTIFFCALSYYIGYMYWRLGMTFPGVHNLQQAGDLMYGKTGATFFVVAQFIFSVFLQGNHALLGGYAFWYLGWRSCMVVMVVVFAIISFIVSLPRSYKLFTAFAAISFTSIMTVVIIAMIASGVSGPANSKPGDPPKRVLAFGATPKYDPDFLDGMLGVMNIFISFGSIPAYLPVMAEMKDPRLFLRSLTLLMSCSLVLYLIVGTIMNYNLGQYVTSPSLGSLTTIMIKICYGLALPTILVAGCAIAQPTAKMFMINVFNSQRRHLLNNDRVVWIVWIVINVITWAIAFVLAEVIPFFSSLLALSSALFWSVFFLVAPLSYLYRHQYNYWGSWRNRVGFLVALAGIGLGFFFIIAGTWAAAISIRDQYTSGNVTAPFSCEIPQ